MVEKSHTSGFWPSLYDPLRQLGERVSEWLAPASEASGDDAAYRIAVELPGVEEGDIHLSVVKTIPREQIVKALTLGASQTAVVYRIVLPQIIPRLVHTVRISLGPAWLFLIASEAISSTSGLGYRIFLVRRYLAMDIIIPYVLWITFLGFLMDWILSRFVEWRYPWYSATR